MDNILPHGKTRAELEKNIFQTVDSIPLADWDSTDWLYSPELDQFIDSWYTLAKYYEINDDIEISVETVSYYIDFARLFRRIITDERFESRHRQQADEKLGELDAMMDELIKQAVTNLNNRNSP